MWPEAIVQKQWQEMANNSPQVKQLKAYQAMADSRLVVQRAPTAMSDEEAREFSNFHKRGYKGEGEEREQVEPEDLSQDAIDEIKDGVFMLSGRVQCNCFAWALGRDGFQGMGNLGHWKHAEGKNYNFVAPDNNAEIILWGTKDGENENTWDVLHASVQLSHDELAARNGKFAGFKLTKEDLEGSDVDDPTWTSAAGMGFPITAHPINWYEGGDFGTALKGMVKK